MELLEIEGMVGIPSPHITQIKPFDQIIERDNSEGKRQAAKELAYIHFMVHWESPYMSYPKDSRAPHVIKDIFGEDSDWRPDEVVVEGLNKYKDLTESEHVRLLNAARAAAQSLITHFENGNISKPKDAKDMIANLSNVGDVVEGIDKLKERIQKHESEKNSNRAGAETNKYSE